MRLPILSIAIVSATLALGGCTSRAHLTTPAGFAQIDGGKFDYRATNPDGVVVGVRSHKNAVHGNLDFWTRVLSKSLEDQAYKPEVGKARNVKTADGVEARPRASRIASWRSWRSSSPPQSPSSCPKPLCSRKSPSSETRSSRSRSSQSSPTYRW